MKNRRSPVFLFIGIIIGVVALVSSVFVFFFRRKRS